MAHYSLSTLLLAGIAILLVIPSLRDIPNFEQPRGNISDYGVSLTCVKQPNPDGLAQERQIQRHHQPTLTHS